jgi:hypothetical protein
MRLRRAGVLCDKKRLETLQPIAEAPFDVTVDSALRSKSLLTPCLKLSRSPSRRRAVTPIWTSIWTNREIV